MLSLVDTHCHLDASPLREDVPGVLARAREAGVLRIVACSFDLRSWEILPELARREGVFPAFGLHPWVASQPLDADRLKALALEHRAVAIGEIGLDYVIEGADPARQREALDRQLTVARDLDLPVLLHARGAFDDLLALLKPHAPNLRGVLHAYSRTPELAKRFMDLGFHVAFGGAITRKNAERARLSASLLPLERILLETDAPSIGLDDVEPSNVEPRHAARVAATLAELRDMTLDEIADQTTRNAESLFRFAR